MEYVLGIDLGTSYFKLGLFDYYGNLVGLGKVAVKKNVDGKKVELPTKRFWSLLKAALYQACCQASTDTKSIKAVSYSSQANTFLLLDRNNNPLTPLILWTDERCEKVPEELTELGSNNKFMQITGQGQNYATNQAATKLIWLRKNMPQVWSSACWFMTISDYLTWSLTGQYVADAGSAALTAMVDVQNMKWWLDALNTVSLKKEQMCKLVRPGTLVGNVNRRGQELLGLSQDTQFVVGSLDHHIAAIGAGIGSVADMSESTGTALACIDLCDEFTPKHGVYIGSGIKRNQYWQLAWDTNGAMGLEWYQQNYAKELTIEELVNMAENVPAGCEGLIAKPMCWTYDGLSGFKGRSYRHSHGHFIRAIMESTAGTLDMITKRLCSSSLPKTIVSTGGGAKSSLWLKIKSNTLGTNVIPSDCYEPACRGAAIIATETINSSI